MAINSSKISIILWNATSAKNKSLELTKFLNDNNTDIAIVTETWLSIKIINYKIHRKIMPNHLKGRVLILT